MYLRYLRVRRFRNLAPVDIALYPGAHLLLGQNGQGKSNFLEAIFTLLRGGSFRRVPLRDLVQWNEPNFFLGGRLALGETESQAVKSSYSVASNQRRILMDDRPSSVSALQETGSVVFLSHEDMVLVSGAPALRRSWADRLIARTVAGGTALCGQYQRAVRQRNQLLQQCGGRAGDPLVQSWTEPWLKLGARLMREHAILIETLNPLVSAYYSRLAVNDLPLRLQHRPGFGELDLDCPQADAAEEVWLAVLQRSLGESRALEAKRGYTVVGPHTDDLEIFLGSAPLQRFGSQGQQRTAALALRLAEIDLVRAGSGRQPIILADEIFGELDRERRGMVWEHLRQAEQLWLTAAQGSGLERFGAFEQRFLVEGGTLSQAPPELFQF